MGIWLIINLRIPGFHNWEDAPEEYKYLSSLHRHEFYIKVEMKVRKNRVYEFIKVKDELITWLLKKHNSVNLKNAVDLMDCPEQSCEGFAEVIAKEFVAENYDCSKVRVTVLEDGENGARVEI